jgi:biopolymer transport protein ExbD
MLLVLFGCSSHRPDADHLRDAPVVAVGPGDNPIISWNGIPLPEENALKAKLAEYMTTHPRGAVRVMPDRDAEFQAVARVIELVGQYGGNIGIIGAAQGAR